MNEKAVKPFGIKDKIGYMFGDFGNDFTFIFSSTFLMVLWHPPSQTSRRSVPHSPHSEASVQLLHSW